MLEKLSRFFGKRRRGLSRVTGIIIAIIFVAVMLPLGIYVTDQVLNAMPQPTNPSLSTALNNTVSNVGSAFNITSIVPIVMVAGGIIAVLMGYLYVGGNE